MTFANLIGYIAAVGTTGAFVPQAFKVYQTKKTDDLSLLTFLFFSCGILLWVWYGILTSSVPVIAANGITFVMTFYIVLMIIKGKKKKS